MTGHPIERRQSSLNEHDLKLLQEAFCGKLTTDEHFTHHNMFRDWLQKEEAKAARREKLKGQFIGSIILGLTGSVGTGLYWIGSYFREHWRQ